MKPLLFFLLMTTSLIATPTAKQNKPVEAVLGGGCFWCMEAIFQNLPGVLNVQSGFAGGTTKNPTYEEVCTGTTGHAEVIRIVYDPKKVSYAELLDLFWRAHNPTTLNQQGADIGSQYRSLILTTTPEQQHLAEASKEKAQAYFSKPIVTKIEPLTVFYLADISHQDYYRNHRNAPYCRAVIAPKLEKLKSASHH